MPSAIEVHCFPFDCFLIVFFACVVAALCYCNPNYPRENIEISHAIRGAGSYNFNWLKTSSVLQSRTSRLREKCPPYIYIHTYIFINPFSENTMQDVKRHTGPTGVHLRLHESNIKSAY